MGAPGRKFRTSSSRIPNMMKSALCFVALIIAATYSFPVEESSWNAQDDLLTRIFSDSAPVAELIQDPRVEESATAAAAHNSTADEAAALEKEWTEKEAAATEAANELGEKQKKLTEKAA